MDKKNKKITFILCTFELGGAENQAVLLATYLKKVLGWDVEFWAFAKEGYVCDLLNSHEISWKLFPIKFQGNSMLIWGSYLRFALAVRKSKPSILMPYTYWPNVICGLVWRITKAKSCVWNQRDEGGGFGLSKLEGRAYKNTPLVVSNSIEGQNFLRQRFPEDKKNILLIKNGIPMVAPSANRLEIRKGLGIAKERKVAIMIANLTSRKDHKTLLAAWKLVVNSYDQKEAPLLLLAGRKDSEYESLLNMANSQDLDDFVRFLGFRDDTANLIAASDICLFSSYLEGTPNGILECMYAGLPVIATNIQGIRECLGVDYKYLVPPKNPKIFSERIIEFLENSSLRREVGMRNKQRVEQEFSLMKMLKSYENLMGDILNK